MESNPRTVAAVTREEGSCATVYVDERRVAQARAAAPDEAAVRDAAETFSLLSDPTRLRLLSALADQELCVCDLAKVLERSMPATSHQLQLLRRAGLVTYRSEGKLAYYSLVAPWIVALVRDVMSRRARAEAA